MKKLIVWWYTFRRNGKEARDFRRKIRRDAIVETKKNILRDLMTGHNLGDFTMTREDLTTFVTMGDNPPYKLIQELYLKYRGNDIRYRD